jgi:hypothetical protein
VPTASHIRLRTWFAKLSFVRRFWPSLCGLLLSASAALAEPKSPRAGKRRAQPVIRAEQMRVEGKIHKPQAFYILQRPAVNFEELDKTERLSSKIEKTLLEEPF